MPDSPGHSDAILAALLDDLEDLGTLLVLSPSETAQLGDLMRTFYRDASLAVRSLVGVSLVMTMIDRDAVVSAFEPEVEATDVAATVKIPVSPHVSANGAAYAVVLHAAEPGAFVDLVSDLEASEGIELDRHLLLGRTTDLGAVRSAVAVDQAEGVLVGRGFTEVGASTFLQALAEPTADTGEAAETVLDTLGTPAAAYR